MYCFAYRPQTSQIPADTAVDTPRIRPSAVTCGTLHQKFAGGDDLGISMKRRAPSGGLPSASATSSADKTASDTFGAKNNSTGIASSASGDELEALLRRHNAESAAIAAAAAAGGDSSATPSKPGHDVRRNRLTVQSMVNFLDGFARFSLIVIAPEFLASLNSEGLGEYVAVADFLMTGSTTTGGENDGEGTEGTRHATAPLAHPGHTYQLSINYATLVMAHHAGRYLGRYLVAGGSYLRTKFGGWDGKIWYARTSAMVLTLHLLTLGLAGRDGLMGRSDTVGMWNWLRFAAGILIGVLMEVGHGSRRPISNDQFSSHEAGVVPLSQSFLIRSYVAGSMCSIVSSTVVFWLLNRYDWANASIGAVSKGPVQATGCILAIFLITERLFRRYCQNIVGFANQKTNQHHVATPTPPASTRRSGQVLKSALRKVSGCRRKGRRGMSASDSDADFTANPAFDANNSGSAAGDVEMGVSWEPGCTPEKNLTSSSALDESQVYHTPDQHYVPGNHHFHDAALERPSHDGSIPSSPTSDITVKASGSTPLFPNEPLMQSPPFYVEGGLTPARSRAGSVNSAMSTRSDMFFDCVSEQSGEDVTMDDFVNDVKSPMASSSSPSSSNSVAIYRSGRVVYPNGEPSHVPPHQSPSVVPQSYIETFSSSDPTHSKAKAKWKESQKWRRERKVWRIHSTPHSHFAEIKKAYPHFVHGFSKAGYIIVYEQPGKMELKGLFRSGCTVDDMIHHYVFLMEYIGNVLSQDSQIIEARRQWCRENGKSELEHWGIMVVMDVSGAGPSMLSGDVLRYLKRAGDTNSAHYPSTIKRAFVVNSPFYLAGIFSGIRNILPESVHVELLGGSSQIQHLTEFIDLDQIPKEYGGTSQYALDQHPFEIGMMKLVESSNSNLRDEAANTSCEQDCKVPGLVTLESASDSATTSATPSVDGDDEDGNFVDIPFGSPSSQPIHRASKRSSAESPLVGTNPALSNHGIKPKTLSKSAAAAETVKRRAGTICSFLHITNAASSRILECTAVLWMLCPRVVGGLRYGLVMTTSVVTSASLLLLWRCSVMSPSGMVLFGQLRQSGKDKASAFHSARRLRIGTGSAAFFSVVLPTAVSAVPKGESFLELALVTLAIPCLVSAHCIGRSSVEQLQTGGNGRRAFDLAGLIGDCIGCVVGGLLFGWSVLNRSTLPVNASLCFFASSGLSFLTYILSYWVVTGPSGEFVLDASSTSTKGRGRRGRGSGGVGLAISDIASLIRFVRSSAAPAALPR